MSKMFVNASTEIPKDIIQKPRELRTLLSRNQRIFWISWIMELVNLTPTRWLKILKYRLHSLIKLIRESSVLYRIPYSDKFVSQVLNRLWSSDFYPCVRHPVAQAGGR